MTERPPPTLRLSNVSCHFGAFTAIRQVTLDIADSEVIAIVGPSGCGKSTLLRLMCGALAPSAGEVHVKGRPIRELSPAEHGVVMVWQSLALFSHLNVARNVGFGLSVRGVPRRELDIQVARALDLVELAGFESRSVTTLSGGEMQRVALARALILRPNVLLLDEPMRALDTPLRARLNQKIRELKARLGLTLVVVTHDQFEAATMATRLIVMRKGAIEQLGSPTDILLRPASAFVAEFVGDRNLFSGSIIRRIDTEVLVRVAETELEARVPEWIPGPIGPGQKVVYVVDSHNVILRAGKSGHLSGRISSIADQGATRFTMIDVDPLGVIKSQRAVESCARELVVGANVTLSWAPSDAYVLPIE